MNLVVHPYLVLPRNVGMTTLERGQKATSSIDVVTTSLLTMGLVALSGAA